VVRKMLRRYESLVDERVDLEIKIQDEKNQQDKIAYLKKKAKKEIEEMKKKNKVLKNQIINMV
jgi:DNA relaxase NicK